MVASSATLAEHSVSSAVKGEQFSQSSFYARLHPCHSATRRSTLDGQCVVFGLAAAEPAPPQAEQVLLPAELVEAGPAELGDPAAVEELVVVLQEQVVPPGPVAAVEAVVGTLGTAVVAAVSLPRYLQKVAAQQHQATSLVE